MNQTVQEEMKKNPKTHLFHYN